MPDDRAGGFGEQGEAIRTTSLISVYTAAAADVLIAAARGGAVAEDAPTWTALRRGLVDQDEAAVTVRFLKERGQAFKREDAELARRRTADQALHDTVVAFLDDCPTGKLEAIDADITHWDAKCREVEGKQDATKEALEGLDEADRAADKESTEISKALHTAESTVDWLDDLILALRDEDNLREILSEEEGRAAKARERASGHADRQVTAAGRRKSTRRRRVPRPKKPDATGPRPRDSRPASQSSFQILPSRSTHSGRTKSAPAPRLSSEPRNRCSPTACRAWPGSSQRQTRSSHVIQTSCDD